MQRLVLAVVALFSLGSLATAQVLDFEQPVYNVGPVASAWGGVDIGKDFVGQGNWSDSISTSGGHINVYPTDGLYNGNQALDTNSSTSQRYSGANNRSGLNTMYNQLGYSISGGFDFHIAMYGSEASVGFWVDRDQNALFDSGENSFHVGAFSAGSLFTPTAFGLQTADGTKYYSDGNGGVTTAMATAQQIQELGWYRAQFEIAQNVNLVDFDVTVSYQHLSAGPFEGLFVDFNALNPGVDAFSLTLTPAEFGMDRTDFLDCLGLAPDGLYANVFRLAAIDNLTVDWSCVCVPEPSSICMMGLGTLGLCLAGRRKWASRRRSTEQAC